MVPFPAIGENTRLDYLLDDQGWLLQYEGW